MSYPEAYRKLIQRIGESIPVPEIEEILLPRNTPASGHEDEFGFVILEDGSVGPFYVCLGDTLAELAGRPLHAPDEMPNTLSIALDLGTSDLPTSALAIGAFNALSQHLMKQAGFDPADNGRHSPELPVRKVGMVGYFPPLVERFLARGCRISIVEQKPERVPDRTGVELHSSPKALAGCDSVICTASTLINGTLGEILSAAGSIASIDIMGPSASGLPDPLFDRGVRSVGGIVIDHPGQLREALINGEKWGDCGRKYQLSAENYPGIETLLDRICRN